MVSIARRQLAEELEGSRQLTSNSFLWSTFDQRLRRYDEIMEYEWFRNGEALRPPRLAELLTLQLAEQAVQQSVVLPERAYDEKFHILQAPGLFLPDLKYFRTLCELRGRPVAVAYADIDNFKALNTKYGESVVDVHILPAFMRALESFVFARGRAYRHGGDEYLILLPNCDQGYAVHLLNNLREEVRTLRYPQVGDTLTVSIGLCVLEVDSFLTDREAQHRANQAKNYAKQAGRDCIASFVGPLYRDDDLTKL